MEKQGEETPRYFENSIWELKSEEEKSIRDVESKFRGNGCQQEKQLLHTTRKKSNRELIFVSALFFWGQKTLARQQNSGTSIKKLESSKRTIDVDFPKSNGENGQNYAEEKQNGKGEGVQNSRTN